MQPPRKLNANVV